METDAFRFTVGDVECVAARDGDEIVPGITVVDAPGHTPGDIAVKISSRGETLLHISDVVLHPLHLKHPEWLPVYDVVPHDAATSKHRIFDLVAAERYLVFAHHVPRFPNSWLREEEQPRLPIGTA